jgi:hypothetical protein
MSTEPNVKSFSATDAHGRTVQITVSTDIVDFMTSARTFGREDLAEAGARGRFQKRMIAIPDRSSGVIAPMVLTISSDNRLYLVRKREGVGGEAWALTDLTAAFPKLDLANVHVRALGVAWTDDDRIAVAVAVDDGKPSSPSHVLVAYDLNSSSDWTNIAWTNAGVRDNLRVDGIRVLAEGKGGWTVVLSGDAGRLQNLYLLRSQGPTSFAQALVFDTAVDYQEIFDFEVACHPLVGSGVVVLGTSGNKRVISLRLFPKYNASGKAMAPTSVVPLPCPDGASVLESGVTRDGGTDLYIGGQGLHLVPADKFYDQDDEHSLIQVASPEAAIGVEELAVADAADGAVAVWARRQNGDLVIVHRPANAGTDQWAAPLRLRQGVQAIAPVQGNDRLTTSLLAVYTDGSAAFLMRDTATGTWRESPLLVAAPKGAARATCYGTNVRLLDVGGFPRVNVPVKVSASALTGVSLNRKNVFIGPDLEIETNTDANGGVQLFDRVRSLTPAVYRITIDGVSGSLDVNPAGNVYERFSTMTPEDLRKASVPLPGGGTTPLLPAEFQVGGARSAELQGMAAALAQAAQLAGQTTKGITSGATQVQAGAAFSSALRVDAVEQGYRWGIQTSSAGVQVLTGQAMDAVIRTANPVETFFADLGSSLADLFESIRGHVQDGWAFIVRKADEAFEFICALGNSIKRFVLNTLEEIGSFFTWLWQEVKTGLEKVWDYLKFIFNWDDILVARDKMVEATTEAIDYVKAQVGTLKQMVESGFDSAISGIGHWREELGVPAALPATKGESFADDIQRAGTNALATVDQAMGNSAIGWVMERLDSLMDDIIHIEGANPAKTAVNSLASFVTGVVGDQFDVLMETFNGIKSDVNRLFDSQLPESDSLSFETVRQLLIMVGSDVAVGLIKSVRSIVVRMIDLLGDMVEVARQFLFARVSFPFIEKLVELVAPGTHIDTSFRIIDVFMLLAAIPATITYKLIFNKAPFTRDEPLSLPFGRAAVQDFNSFIATATGFLPFAQIALGFIKMGKGLYGSISAAKGDFDGSKIGLVLGIPFGIMGVAAGIFARREKEGNLVTAMQWVGILCSSLSVVTSIGLIIPMWQDVKKPESGSNKISAGVEVFQSTVALAVAAVAFGVIVDNTTRSGLEHEKRRVLPETFQWIATLMDQLGDILVGVAALLPQAAMKAKVILIAGGMVGKAAHTTCTILKVISTKELFEAFDLAQKLANATGDQVTQLFEGVSETVRKMAQELLNAHNLPIGAT